MDRQLKTEIVATVKRSVAEAMDHRQGDVGIHQRDDSAMAARSRRHAAEDTHRVDRHEGRKARDIVPLPAAPYTGDVSRRQNQGTQRKEHRLTVYQYFKFKQTAVAVVHLFIGFF